MNNKNGIALTVSCNPPPGLARQTQCKTIVSNKDYSTSVKTCATNPPAAETKALWLLRKAGFKNIQQLDWIAQNDEGNWVVFEIKQKELFTPGRNFPHYGIGLNKSQLWLRTQLLKELGWRTYLINFVPKTDDVYGAYLNKLESKGGFYDTPNGIRVYPISSFMKRTKTQKEGGRNGS